MSRKPQPILLELWELDAGLLERILLDWLRGDFAKPDSLNYNHARQLVRKLHEARSPVVRA